LSFILVIKNLKIKIYRTIILLLVLYGCKTWSLTLRKKHTPSVVENKVLRRIFGLKRDEVTGELRKLHTQYCSVNQNKNEMGGACSAYGGEERHIQGFGWET